MAKKNSKLFTTTEDPSEVTENSAELDEDMMAEFADKLETTINMVCEKYAGRDPRLELMVTLGLFAAQVSTDAGYDRDEFTDLMADMYDDYTSGESDVISMEFEMETDPSKLN